MHFTKRILVVCLLGLMLQGCSDSKPEIEGKSHSVQNKIAITKGTPVVEPASLRNILPENSLAYFRLPDIWGFLAAGKGEAFDLALANNDHSEQVALLQKGIRAFVNSSEMKELPSLLRAYSSYLQAPLELAVIPPLEVAEGAPDIPRVLLVTALNVQNVNEANDLLLSIVADNPVLQLQKDFSDNGVAELVLGFVSVFCQFDEKTQALTLMAGMGLNKDQFSQTITALVAVPDHPIKKAEASIDTSGNGLFIWVNLKKSLSRYSALIPAPIQAILGVQGIYEAEFIALGLGSTGSKGKLQLHLEMPLRGYRAAIPSVQNNFDFKFVGVPALAFSLYIPDGQQITAIENVVFSTRSMEDQYQYRQLKDEFTAKVGFSIEDILASLGPELMFFMDDAGEYLALKLRDPQKFKQLLAILTEKFEAKITSRNIGDLEITHLEMSSLRSLLQEEGLTADLPEEQVMFLNLLSRIQNHLFWTQENDFIIFATVPQSLRDRRAQLGSQTMQQWLNENQGQNPSSALGLASFSVKKSPRYMYYGYLGVLSFLNDMVEGEMDIFAFPTAYDLNLPDKGSYGAQVNASDSEFSYELTFEHNVMDVLVGANQGMAMVAMTGIAAAIAIPQYQTYKLKAEVQQVYGYVNSLKANIEMTYGMNGVFPNGADIAAMAEPPHLARAQSIIVTPDTGEIVITFADSVKWQIGDSKLILQPHFDGAQFRWSCESNMKHSFLPSYCQ